MKLYRSSDNLLKAVDLIMESCGSPKINFINAITNIADTNGKC